MATTADKLKFYRRGRGLTQKELAQKSDVRQSTIAQIERGNRPRPWPSTLRKLADALDIEPLDLLSDEEVP